jgi:signal transduction histidine kinase/ActR/RegA family two-component response regulator/HAMP domain-containing protein
MSIGGPSIRRRIYGGFAVVLLLLGAELLVARRGFDRVQALRDELAEHIDPPAAAAEAFERTVLRRAIAVRNQVVTGDLRHREEYGRSLDEARAVLERMRRFEMGPRRRAAVEAIDEASLAHIQETDAFLALLHRGAGPEALAPAEWRLAAARERLLGRVHAFVAAQRDLQDAARLRATDLQQEVSRALLATALLVAAALALTAFVTVRALRRPALALVRAAGALEAGDYAPALALAKGPAAARAGELGHLARAFARMADALRRREERLAVEGRIGASLATTLEPHAAAEAALREIAGHVGAAAGAVYLVEGEALVRAAGLRAAAPELLRREGLAAEALATGRPALARGIPADLPFALDAAFGEVRPRSVMAAPLIARGERVGLLLLGSLDDLDADAGSAVARAGAQLAIALQNALAHRRLGALAAELRASNGRLQTQNEELHAQAEEIRAQADELQAHSERIRRHNGELAVAREALAQKAAALEHVDRRRNELLATIGHELRNPLAAVAAAGRVLESTGGVTVARHAAVIGRQTLQLRGLVDDLLELSRLTEGTIELRREQVDLRDALRRAASGVEEAARAKGQQLALSTAAGAVLVDADPRRVEQVLATLLRNAVRCTPAGGRVAAAVDAVDGHAIARVADGGGLPAELLPRFFEPFVQGMHSEGGEAGPGLGLALARRVVELHGGEVEARAAADGKGAEAVARLPLAAGVTADAAHPPRAARGDMRLSVLVVEDNPDVAETTADALELFGYAVRVARDAEEGLRAVVESVPDVALLDIGLPGRSGNDLARDTRARLGRDGVRLVAVTGYGHDDDRRRALEAGFDAHLVKPVDLDELRAVIERLAFQGAIDAVA